MCVLHHSVSTIQFGRQFKTFCGFTYHVPSGHGPVVRHSRARRILKKWLSSKAWRIANDHAEGRHLQLPTEKSDSPVMIALTREVAERVLNEEELRLSHEVGSFVHQDC